jgi:hypothetical protein
MNPLPPGLVPHGARVRSVAQKDAAVERDPLAGIFVAMRDKPLLLNFAVTEFFERWHVGDRHVDTLLLGQRKRFKRTQQPILEYHSSSRTITFIVMASCGTEGPNGYQLSSRYFVSASR